MQPHSVNVALQARLRPRSAGPVGPRRSESTSSMSRVEVSALSDATKKIDVPRLVAKAGVPDPKRFGKSLAVEIQKLREPPPTEIPVEFHIYDLASDRQPALLLPAADGGGRQSQYRIFPSTRPSSRSEVRLLAQALDRMLDEAGARTADALLAWDLTLAELVRQTFVHCAERGELLGRVRRAYSHYIGGLLSRVRFMEGTERESELRRLESENGELRSQLGDSQAAFKRSSVLGRFRSAYSTSNALAVASAEAEAEKQKHAAGSKGEACLKAFAACPLDEQQAVWKDMLVAASGKARKQLVLAAFRLLSDSAKPEMMKQLAQEMSPE
jgi:hypothetical protein